MWMRLWWFDIFKKQVPREKRLENTTLEDTVLLSYFASPSCKKYMFIKMQYQQGVIMMITDYLTKNKWNHDGDVFPFSWEYIASCIIFDVTQV